LLDDVIAVTAAAAVEIELERAVAAHGGGHGVDGFVGQQRAAEVGVDDGAGAVDRAAQARRGKRIDAGGDGRIERRRRRHSGAGRVGTQPLPLGGEFVLRGALDQGRAEPRRQFRQRRSRQQPVDGGQLCEPGRQGRLVFACLTRTGQSQVRHG